MFPATRPPNGSPDSPAIRQASRDVEGAKMTSRHKHLRRRLAMLEESLGKRSQPSETSLYVQVGLEAQQQLSSEDLSLFQSAEAAREEGRFHSLEEHAVMQKFSQLRDVVARRYGYGSYGGVLRDCIASQPQSKRSAKQSQELINILHWGRDNCAHLQKLRQALQASKSNSSALGIAPDPSSDLSSPTPLPHPNL